MWRNLSGVEDATEFEQGLPTLRLLPPIHLSHIETASPIGNLRASLLDDEKGIAEKRAKRLDRTALPTSKNDDDSRALPHALSMCSTRMMP